ncbi:hypothetical protein GJ744_009405 [Endocarpon pusillum]|uniref:Uncharacterized protein n=1 Tax=Endocarpon pusillum TaxID=364733 RepID=A0A8H7AFP6_9EURO|nr:hypothetical protein GJ744_009405 [Endocarpon pusillum]
MRVTSVLRAVSHGRTPLIKFIGKRSPPKSVDHTPHAHPASPSESLPDSFANYRSKAQQHGPLAGGGGSRNTPSAPISSLTYGAVGGRAGRKLGPVQPKQGEYFDRNELPIRFRRTAFTEAEMEAIQTGGASLYG